MGALTPTGRITDVIADEIDRSAAVRPELAGWLARLAGRLTSRVADAVRAAGLDVGAAVAAERSGIVTYARAFGGVWREKAPDAWAAISDLSDLIERGDHDPGEAAMATISDVALPPVSDADAQAAYRVAANAVDHLARVATRRAADLHAQQPQRGAALSAVERGTADALSALRTEHCAHCGQSLPVTRFGRVAAHRINPTDSAGCPGSGLVPWRLGTPDAATVRRHLQVHPSVEIPVAFFQVHWMGVFPGIVGACIEESGEVQWGYGFAIDAKKKTHAGIIAMHGSVDDLRAWSFRPIDVLTHEPRPWRDGED